jgi:hypothetical protein
MFSPNNDKGGTKVSQAEEILLSVFEELNLHTDKEKYDNIYQVIKALEKRNLTQTISAGTTGKITESLVEIALNLSAKDSFSPNTSKFFSWVGDFVLMGIPFNVIVSVKSFSAKERLLVSGSGTALAPTIGYGWFKNPEEFKNKNRLQAYKVRGFTSIYMPKYTLKELPNEAKQFTNINGNPFLRLIENFPEDISMVMGKNKYFEASDTRRFANPFKL